MKPTLRLRFVAACALSLVFPVAVTSSWAVASETPAPRVAVFVEKGFPVYGPGEMSSPQAIAAALNRAGVRADILDIDALASPERFKTQTYAAIVLPYGNTFPQTAFANLRTFHQSGGSLITSGIPFTHPIIRAEERGRTVWRDLGHADAPARFGLEGIGVGGFTGVEVKSAQPSQGDPWRLASLASEWQGEAQALDTANLPPETEVRPALVAGGKPLAALIVHRNGPFRNAVDAWTNFPHPTDLLEDAYVSEQIMERATVAALFAKGSLTKEQHRKAFAVLDRMPKPPRWAQVTLPNPPRPYPTLQPKRSRPAEHLYVADMRRLDKAQKLLLSSLQGLVNRTQPRIFLVGNEHDAWILDVMQQQGHTGKPTVVADPLSLLTTFRSAFRGVVVSDPRVYASPCVAVDLAGLDDLLVATPEIAAQWKIPIKADLRGRFKDNADAFRYVRTKLLPRLNSYLALCIDPPLLGSQVDDVIAARGMVFWVTGQRAQDKPGANERAEYIEIAETLARMPLGAIVRGYWWNGDKMGLDEYPGVRLGSRFGKITTVSDYVGNYSVMSGIELPAIKQKSQPPAPTLDASKVYLAITMSDGDNLSTWPNYWRGYFEDPLHGTIPIGYGMGPTLIDLCPPIVQWFYEHAAPTDEFLCDVSGVGYISPSDWGRALKNEPAVFRQFFDWTQEYMNRLDMKTIRINDVGPEQIARVGANLPATKFIMPDYGYAGERNYSQLTYPLPTGQTVFRAATFGPEGQKLADEVRSRVGTARPAFLNVFVQNWGSRMSELKRMLEILGPEYVAVTPSQLNALYRQAQARPQMPVLADKIP